MRHPGWFLAALVVALALTPSAPAVAAPARADIADEKGDNGASFTSEPTDVTRVLATWDGATLVVTVEYAAPPPTYKLRLLMSGSSEQTGVDEACAFNTPDRIAVAVDVTGPARLELSGVDGELDGTASTAGARATYSFSHPSMTRAIETDTDPFTCLDGEADGDAFYGGFDGKVLKFSERGATAALRAALAERFGKAFTSADRRWAICPREEIIPESEDRLAYAYCQFEFGTRGVYRDGWTSTWIVNGRYDASTDLEVGKPYRKTLRACRIAARKTLAEGVPGRLPLTGRRLRASGLFNTGRGCGRGADGLNMVSDIDYYFTTRIPRKLKVGLHGTNQAGFEERAVFPCKWRRRGRRYTFDCRNRLGDRFVYSVSAGSGRVGAGDRVAALRHTMRP